MSLAQLVISFLHPLSRMRVNHRLDTLPVTQHNYVTTDMGLNLGGLCPFREGGDGSHLTQCGQGRGLPACQVSSWSVKPFGHNTPTSQTGQDRQRSDSIGRTVSQMVAQKSGTTQWHIRWPLPLKLPSKILQKLLTQKFTNSYSSVTFGEHKQLTHDVWILERAAGTPFTNSKHATTGINLNTLITILLGKNKNILQMTLMILLDFVNLGGMQVPVAMNEQCFMQCWPLTDCQEQICLDLFVTKQPHFRLLQYITFTCILAPSTTSAHCHIKCPLFQCFHKKRQAAK